MTIKFFKEEERYYETSLKSKFLDTDNCEYEKVVNSLLQQRYLKLEGDEKGKHYFKFKYVGIIMTYGKYLCIYPKYINDSVVDEFKRVMITFNEYRRRNNNLLMSKLDSGNNENSNDNDVSNNILPLALFLMNYYFENGLYIKDKYIFEINGMHEIDWNMTINGEQPIIKGKNPYYLKYYTIDTENDFTYIITKINKWVLNVCSNIVSNFDVLGIFNMPKLEFDVESVYDMDQDDIEYQIEKELNIQFDDDKITLLKVLLEFVKKHNSSFDEIYAYGTRSFNVFWEQICSYVFLNQYVDFKSNISNPIWRDATSNHENKTETIIPDIIYDDGNDYVYIWDAKYYNMEFTSSGKLKGTNPGIEDIVKQYAYGLWGKKLFQGKRMAIFNSLVFPKEVGRYELTYMGKVDFEVFSELGSINIISLITHKVYNRYINRKPFSYDEIKEFLNNSDAYCLSVNKDTL